MKKEYRQPEMSVFSDKNSDVLTLSNQTFAPASEAVVSWDNL